MHSERALAIFDFDKTLVRQDSFRLFSRLAAADPLQRLHVLLLAVGSKAGVLSNAAYKDRVLQRCWRSKAPADQAEVLSRLERRLRSIENANVVRRLRSHLEQQHNVVVMSASPVFYVRPFVRAWGDAVDVYGSSFNGASSENLYGARKAGRARQLIRQHRPEVVWVYTDHLSDLPLIELADRVGLVRPSAKLLRTLRQRDIPFEVLTA